MACPLNDHWMPVGPTPAGTAAVKVTVPPTKTAAGLWRMTGKAVTESTVSVLVAEPVAFATSTL